MIQSYLIIGTKANTRQKSQELLNSLDSVFSTNSPDISIVTPAKNVTTIDQVREIRSKINQKPIVLPYKYVIFEAAHTLNKEAQNALLKTLEEPPASTVIILEATDRTFFLPTLLSRVILIHAENSNEIIPTSESLLSSDLQSLLVSIGETDNAHQWIDSQMILLYQQLQKSFQADKPTHIYQRALENCKEAKKMIDANVNPKFVLANLVLQMH